QGKTEHAARRVVLDHVLRDVEEIDVLALLDRDRLSLWLRQLRMRLAHGLLDLADDLLRLVRATVGEKPARALGDEPADREDAQREDRADQEAEPPADRFSDVVQELVGEKGRQRRPEPPAAVDRESDAAANPGRNQLVDRGVDRRVLPADAGPARIRNVARLQKFQ